MLVIAKMCYTCLKNNCEDLIDLFQVDRDNLTYLQKLKACVPFELQDFISQQMCTSCIKQLQIAYQFKEMILTSQEIISKRKSEINTGTSMTETKLNQVRSSMHELLCKPYNSCKNEKDTVDASTNNFHQHANEKINGLSDYNYNNTNSDYCFADFKDEIEITNTNVQHDNDDVISATSNQYQCSKCTTVLPSSHLQEHICIVDVCYNEEDTKETFIKYEGDKSLMNRRKSKRKTTDRKEDLEFQCYHCSIIFAKRWKLQKHISRVHCNNKKHICTYCNKAFKQSYHLREHLTSHTGERNYTCSFCDKSFQRISSMRRHSRTHDAAPGQKTKKTPFLCTVCGKSFPFSNGVQRHMRIHLGIRNHECKICSKKFTQSTHLHVHMRTHTGEKPYICDTCGDAFSLKVSLQKHMMLHKHLDLYKCDEMLMEKL